MNDWQTQNIKTGQVFLKVQKEFKYKGGTQLELENRFQYDFDKNTLIRPKTRFEMRRKKQRVDIINVLLPLIFKIRPKHWATLLKSPRLIMVGIRNEFRYYSAIQRSKKLAKFYDRHAEIPDLKQKYIYFPLHLQPELSTAPMAGSFVDQLLITQMVGYSLPKNVYIYVKENPFQDFTKRELNFYQDLLDIPQVRFVPMNFDTYELTDHSIALVTATGTAGLEALYRGKPVLLFGSIFYQYAKGVYRISNNDVCKQTLTAILKHKTSPTTQDIKLYLKSLERTTINGYIDLDYKKDTKVSQKVSNSNISKALINEIAKMLRK
ncbi:hypothetical protein A2585_01685 [Candidatus Nomurabacteria bacterium RIFOXYD1_FULL_39_12]|nr:MAG: hypothetical protein A2585_01685 [Candidatus Nomurabacteria bacterium RIFOXYD1_FULL_39_12]